MLHWPETMFTYLEDERILFSCDFFGFHTAVGLYDDDFADLEYQARRYYGEIMMPYATFGKRALEKLKDKKIDFICPSHGPIYKSPKRIIDYYNKWTSFQTDEKIVIIYTSMWKDIEKMVDRITDYLLAHNIKFSRYNLQNADPGDICADLVDSKAVIFGAPTVLASMHPLGIYGAYLIKVLRPPLRYALLLSSYGWAESAISQMKQIFSPLKLEIIGELAVYGPANKEDMKTVEVLVGRLIERIRAKDTQEVDIG